MFENSYFWFTLINKYTYFFTFIRYGKEDKLVNLFGIMQALVSFVQDDKDNLCSIVSGNHQFVFVCRGPLVLVAVSQTCQSISQASLIHHT